MNLKNENSNMQDGFINNCRHSNVEVDIYLLNNSVEQGVIVAFDNASIVLKNHLFGQFIIMKKSIVSIKPKSKVNYIFNKNKRYDNQNKQNFNNGQLINESIILPSVSESYIYNQFKY